jgi:hypothetical protein
VTRPRAAGGDRNQVSRRQMNMDILLGVLGFLAFSALLSTVGAEVQGRDALKPALITLMLVILLFLVAKLRRLK